MLTPIPKLKRVMPAVMASSIVGISPMTGPTGSIFTLRHAYQPIECFATYSDQTATGMRPEKGPFLSHILTIEGRYKDGGIAPIPNLTSCESSIRKYLTDNFGKSKRLDSRWGLWNVSGLVVAFTTKADTVAFMLWFRGKSVKEIIEYYD